MLSLSGPDPLFSNSATYTELGKVAVLGPRLTRVHYLSGELRYPISAACHSTSAGDFMTTHSTARLVWVERLQRKRWALTVEASRGAAASFPAVRVSATTALTLVECAAMSAGTLQQNTPSRRWCPRSRRNRMVQRGMKKTRTACQSKTKGLARRRQRVGVPPNKTEQRSNLRCLANPSDHCRLARTRTAKSPNISTSTLARSWFTAPNTCLYHLSLAYDNDDDEGSHVYPPFTVWPGHGAVIR